LLNSSAKITASPDGKPFAGATTTATRKLLEKTKTDETIKRSRLIHCIQGYHDKFPQFGGALTPDQIAQLHKIKDPDELVFRLEQMQKEIASPYAEGIFRELFLDCVTAGEYFFTHMLPRVRPDLNFKVQGTSFHLRSHPEEIDTEIKELSILWAEWLQQGPFARLIVKTIRAAYMMHITNVTLEAGEQRKGMNPGTSGVNQEMRNKFASL
jgi:hypothetical protein